MTDTENIPQGNCEISVKNPPRKSCWGCLAALTVILILLAFGIYKLWTIEVYSGNIVSPCGKYRVDYYYYFRESLMPMMPGSSSDKSGCLYIYRQSDNKMLFREEVPMIQVVGDIRFDQNESGNTRLIYAPAWLVFAVEEK